MSNHETEAYLEKKFEEGLDKGMSDLDAAEYARSSLLQSDIFNKEVMKVYEAKHGDK